MIISAVIFDLDGVVVSTDEYHYNAWKELADCEHIEFCREDNALQKGVNRMESLEVLLRKSAKRYTPEEKLELCDRKNNYYLKSLDKLSPSDILPGAIPLVEELKKRKIPIAIGSSSRNAALIIKKIGLCGVFDAMADGTMIRNSKPHPEVFTLAAKLLNKRASECVVIEDAAAGIEAAINAGMKAIGIGSARNDRRAILSALDLSFLSADEIIKIF